MSSSRDEMSNKTLRHNRASSSFQEYAGYDHSNYSIPHIDRESVEFAFCIEVQSDRNLLNQEQDALTRIHETTGARILIKETVDSMWIVDIHGTRRQVLEAVNLVKESLTKDSMIVSERALILLRVPPEMIGCLIGKAGKNIKSIKESSRVGIRVDMMEEKSQIQTVRITGGIEEVLDAYQKVCDSLRTFDPKKSRMAREVSESNLDGSASSKLSQFGGSPTNETPLTSSQTAFIIQTPNPSSIQDQSPPILALQSDDSYEAVPVVYQTLPISSVRDSGTAQDSRISSSSTVQHR
eukprot:g4328.t1